MYLEAPRPALRGCGASAAAAGAVERAGGGAAAAAPGLACTAAVPAFSLGAAFGLAGTTLTSADPSCTAAVAGGGVFDGETALGATVAPALAKGLGDAVRAGADFLAGVTALDAGAAFFAATGVLLVAFWAMGFVKRASGAG